MTTCRRSLKVPRLTSCEATFSGSSAAVNRSCPRLERYAERDSFNVALHLLLAREYAAAGQDANAEKVYVTLADQSPTAEIFGGLFTLYQAQGKMAQAVNLLDEALGKSDPKDGTSAGNARRRPEPGPC